MASQNEPTKAMGAMAQAAAGADEARRARDLERMTTKLQKFMDDPVDEETMKEDLFAEIAGEDGKIS